MSKGLNCPFSHEKNHSFQDCITVNIDDTANFHNVEGGVGCRFADGAKVVELKLGNDGNNQRTISISGLTEQVSIFDVEARLSPYGSASSIRRKVAGKYALATCRDTSHAAAAADALNGSPLTSWTRLVSNEVANAPYGGRKSYTSTSVVAVAKLSPGAIQGRCATVKVLWYAPSRCAWVHFASQKQAQKATNKCNATMFGERHIVAKLQAATTFRPRSFSMWVANLPEAVSEKELRTFFQNKRIQSPMSISLGDIPFRDREGSDIICCLLNSSGRLTSFEESPVRHPLERRSLAKFSTSDEADHACRRFRTQQGVDELGGNSLFLTRICTAKMTLLNPVFRVVETDILKYLSASPNVRYHMFHGAKTTSVSLTSENPHHIATARRDLKSSVSGDVLLDNHLVNLCRSPHLYLSFRSMVDDENSKANAFAYSDKRRQEIRVFGPSEGRDTLKQKLKGLLETICLEKLAVPVRPTISLF